ncbi:ATP-binding protein [Brevundimonas goettingensis]|uniref:histidine kinase n=1 Tax=Brevundimonas goettingensis TaxID=2774190 RepID=A0A975GUC3_9CAUL|nr:ATP-binding protein [Brevundimonas goettingensis]QTC89711.1 HAMP domain-containing histidine kinase [Brevundimonas goettingensis]
MVAETLSRLAGLGVWRDRNADVAASTGWRNMQLLIQLRWIAVAGQILAILVVHFGMKVALPLQLILAAPLALLAFNILGLQRLKLHPHVSEGELVLSLLVDVAALTWQLYLSGGAANPFTPLYLLQVVLASVLLRPLSAWLMVGVTTFCSLLLLGVHRPLLLPERLQDNDFSLYLQGSLVCFGLIAFLLVVFVTRISGNLRARDSYLAEMRQREAEEDHIVRMGLLASGAAHELGTPLSSLAVILGDWRRMPIIKADPELSQDIADMQAEVERCKSIVTGILMSAGEARGQDPVVTTPRALINDLIAGWKPTRPGVAVTLRDGLGEDVNVVSDPALLQVLVNVLDNAAEAGATDIVILAERPEDDLSITVSDNGSGFADSVLARFGQPYQSTKNRPGAGLGLFLLSNVLRKLGGEVQARNRKDGGAVVVLRLPLSAIALPGKAS